MNFKKLFPCALVACFALNLMLATANAQTFDNRLRQVTTINNFDGESTLINDFQIISEASPTAIKKVSLATASSALRFEQMLMGAIDTRLGSSYVWGAAGPRVFDCSGFVWSSFREVGINFDRVSARTLWSRFQAPREDEKFKMGTLVFFSGLTHVGIVADEKGFYHASRRKGVIYSPFNEFWLKRVDGFRRVPLPMPALAE